MKTTIAAAALCLLTSFGAQAASPKNVWYLYRPVSQTCAVSEFNPLEVMKAVRESVLVTPEADDQRDEATGKITATTIYWHNPSDADPNMKMVVHLYRSLADCNSYAELRRVDQHKYD